MVFYALGEKERINLEFEYQLDHKTIQKNLTKYRRLTEWDSLYLVVLFITHISLDQSLSSKKKLKTVVEWMITDFRLSLVSITFASVFFGRNPLKKMMKFKKSQSAEKKLKDLFNMTWDLYNLNSYFRMWTERESLDEGMFVSGDKAFNAILRNSVDVQNQGNLRVFENFLSTEDIDYIEKITSSPECHFERAFESEKWSPTYRAELIEKYEQKLGVNSKEI